MKRYIAYWYESDEWDQWMQCSEHPTLEVAKKAAFFNATKHQTHLWANVTESTLHSIKYGWVNTGSWVNHADSGTWSGWIEDGVDDET